VLSDKLDGFAVDPYFCKITTSSPSKYFNASPEIIRLAVMYYIRYPLSFRQVEDIWHERGVDICHETVRFWVERFGSKFAREIRKNRAGQHSNWQWRLYEVFVKINGYMYYLWRAVDREGEIQESHITKRRDHKLALKFLRKTMKCCGQPKVVVTDKIRSYGATMKVIGNADRQETGRWVNNRAENSHLPFGRRERPMLRFRRTATLQKFLPVHASIQNHFNKEHHLCSRTNFKLNRAAALAEWRQLLSV